MFRKKCILFSSISLSCRDTGNNNAAILGVLLSPGTGVRTEPLYIGEILTLTVPYREILPKSVNISL